MVGVIIILFVLLLFIPISVMLSGAALTSVLGGTIKSSVDAEYRGTEELAISEANPYDGPESPY